ncbi:MAG TPA: ELM1/GtrOC1 family putative glycosyltransferase [Wenzhouxiangellaceae bacterium]|nr:ELM1/GtrOC1 family putative glycosyltransferase [Wenzhouxiangellaceae bacterium]
MPDPDHCPEPGLSPTAWVLAAPGAGDNGQLKTLVEVLNADARWIDQVDPVPRVLRDRLTGFRARGVPSEKRLIYTPPWPDLVLIAGGRAVIDARRIQHASGGKSRVVCLGRPWAPLDWFDLIITTPQYRLPEAENVVMLDLPLNLPPRATEDVLAHWRDEFECLPRPMLGVLLGGDSGSYRLDANCADGLAESINRIASECGGSAVVVGSPRTPQNALKLMVRRLEVPAQIYAWKAQAPNPYASVLRLADALLVSGDSASMLAEACYAEKSVGLIHLRERARSRLNRNFRTSMSTLMRTTQALTGRGLWIPARDMRELHRRVAEAGWLTNSASLLVGSSPTTAPEKPFCTVRKRVYELLKC